MSKDFLNQNQILRLQEKQATRQRGAVKHKIQDIPFEILPVPLRSPKHSHVDKDGNENRPSSLIRHSGKKDSGLKSHLDMSVVRSPSVFALHALNDSRQKKMYKHSDEIREKHSLYSARTPHRISTPSFARRTGSPAMMPPPRISIKSTPLKEHSLNDNVTGNFVKQPSKGAHPLSKVKRFKKSRMKQKQNEVINPRKISEISINNQHFSDKEEYSDRDDHSYTEDEEHDDSYDEINTKVAITVHKFSERGAGSVNEIDVVSQAVLELLKRLRRKTESVYAKKVIHAFEEEVAVKFLEMTDILDNYMVLDSAVKKSARNIAQMRNELFTIRKARSDTSVKMCHLRQRYNDFNNENQSLKSIQNFFEEIDILHGKIPSNVRHTEKTGIISLLNTITPFMGKSWGVLERLTAFNTFLEKVDKVLT